MVQLTDPRPQGHVIAKLDNLGELVETLRDELNSLDTMLQPVMPPVLEGEAKAGCQIDGEAMSPLAERLERLCEQLRNRISHVRSLQSRIEL